jgi:hypothetical protein
MAKPKYNIGDKIKFIRGMLFFESEEIMNSYQPQADEGGFLTGTVLEVTRYKNGWVYVVGIESETVITDGGGLFTWRVTARVEQKYTEREFIKKQAIPYS